MIIKSHIDPIAAYETLLLELFQKIFQNDGAQRYLGFSQVSQLATLDGLPSWYLWFSEKRGAYSLTLIDGDTVSGGDNMSDHQESDTLEARFLVRYFPDPGDDSFDALSCFEQIARLGHFFDSTGTPSFDGGRAIHDGFFVAGYVDILIHSSRADVDFFCSAPNRWREYRLDGLKLTDERGESREVVSPGTVDRDFPGWDLSFFIFDKIVSSFCFLSGQAPRRTGAAARPFFRYEIDAEQHVNAIPDTDITESVFGVCFSNGTGEDTVKEREASFVEQLHSQDYALIGIWGGPDEIPAQWRRPEWWTINTTHFHADPDHVCSCYEDH